MTWRKPFYHLDEVMARWTMSERDLRCFVLAGELTLSVEVAGLRVAHGIYETVDDGTRFPVPEGFKTIFGALDLFLRDAVAVIDHGGCPTSAFKAQGNCFLDVSAPEDDDEFIVRKEHLAITRLELERFEDIQMAGNQTCVPQASDDEKLRRGAPARFDWDRFWIEVCAGVHEEGIPATQSDLIRRMAQWYQDNHGAAPDDSTIAKKLRPLWARLKNQGAVAAPSPASRPPVMRSV